MIVKDFLDQKLKLGDIIVYPGRHGSSLWINHAKIVGFLRHIDEYQREIIHLQVETKSGKVVTISRLDRVVKVNVNKKIDLFLHQYDDLNQQSLKNNDHRFIKFKPIINEDTYEDDEWAGEPCLYDMIKIYYTCAGFNQLESITLTNNYIEEWVRLEQSQPE